MGSRTLWQDILVASRQEADAEGVTDTIVAEVANTTRITCDTTTSMQLLAWSVSNNV